MAIWAGIAAIAAAVMVAGCASAPHTTAPPPDVAPAPLDHSYDWHVLLTTPLGTPFRDTPFALHEVLLFRDENKRGDGDAGDCYAVDGSAPTFVARAPEEYLLCFKHDRLSHVEATVRVPHDQAAQIFADACGLWFKNAALPVPAIATATESSPAVCSGQEGMATEFSGRLEIEPNDADMPLSITLDVVEQR